jgi:hypothetical protein
VPSAVERRWFDRWRLRHWWPAEFRATRSAELHLATRLPSSRQLMHALVKLHLLQEVPAGDERAALRAAFWRTHLPRNRWRAAVAAQAAAAGNRGDEYEEDEQDDEDDENEGDDDDDADHVADAADALARAALRASRKARPNAAPAGAAALGDNGTACVDVCGSPYPGRAGWRENEAALDAAIVALDPSCRNGYEGVRGRRGPSGMPPPSH